MDEEEIEKSDELNIIDCYRSSDSRWLVISFVYVSFCPSKA